VVFGMVATTGFARQFVPKDLDPANLAQLMPLYEGLRERVIASTGELVRWLGDVSELTSVVDEFGNRRYIEKSCHTDDAQIEKRYLQYVEEIEPKIKPAFFQVQKKYLASPYREQLDRRRYEILDRQWQADVELYRDENVPLQTEATKLVTEYDKTCGAQMVSFEGKEYTVQQMNRFLEQTDRDERQRAWEATAARRMADREKIEGLFDQLLGLRAKIGANAGVDNFRSYVWKSYKRFDYTPEQCHTFADAVAEAVVPVVKELDRQRRADLGLERLSPWDGSVDPKGRPPLEPFKQEDVPGFVEKTRGIFERLSPALAEDFDVLRRRNSLDLDSRKGKQPGGYQCSLEEVREPFIFMNAAGMHGDVITLLHEGGHAFHCLAAREEPLVFLRSAPMEFCEVASMSMELLGADHYDMFYDEADAARAKRQQIERVIRILPWIATIDSFQQWLYTSGRGGDHAARTARWLEILGRFEGDVDWSGHEAVRESSWQRQLHLFHAPFYYIEYGIAQLGALQLWMKSREDPRRALANYRAALALGGTRTLPELFAAAGIRFDFSAKTLMPLMEAAKEELEQLPR
jgi:oligoendopeptidase F